MKYSSPFNSPLYQNDSFKRAVNICTKSVTALNTFLDTKLFVKCLYENTTLTIFITKEVVKSKYSRIPLCAKKSQLI